MPYKLTVEKEDKYIRTDLYDPFTESDIDSAVKQVLAICQEQKLRSILCDERQLKLPPDDVVGFSTAERLAYHGIKLAIIRNHVEEKRLFDVVASNRGIFVKVFSEEEDAKQWLKQTNSPPEDNQDY